MKKKHHAAAVVIGEQLFDKKLRYLAYLLVCLYLEVILFSIGLSWVFFYGLNVFTPIIIFQTNNH